MATVDQSSTEDKTMADAKTKVEPVGWQLQWSDGSFSHHLYSEEQAEGFVNAWRGKDCPAVVGKRPIYAAPQPTSTSTEEALRAENAAIRETIAFDPKQGWATPADKMKALIDCAENAQNDLDKAEAENARLKQEIANLKKEKDA